jgi:lysophospholipase L1-like esterase
LDSRTQNYPLLEAGSFTSASLLIAGAAPPVGWRVLDSSIGGLSVMIKSSIDMDKLAAIYSTGEKGFAIFANGGPLFQDVARTIPADGSLDSVWSIQDSSPRNTPVAATLDTKRPLLKITPSGSPYLYFDASNDALEIPSASFGNGAMAFVCSVSLRNAASSYPHVLGPMDNGIGIYAGFLNASPRWVVSGAGVITSATPIPLNTRTTIAYIYTGTNLELYVSGVLVGSVAYSGTYSVVANHGLCLSGVGVFASPLDFFGGVYVGRNVTTEEREYLEGLVSSTAPVPNEAYIKQVTLASEAVDVPTIIAAITPNIQAMVDAGIKDALLRVGVNYSLAPLITSTKVYSLGDSTVADYTYPGLVDLVSTVRVIVDIATPGDTIAGQKSKWLAQTIDPALVGWVVVQIGLNDMNPTDGTTASKIAELQDLITTIRGEIGATKKLLIAKMLPCKQRYIDVYGATNGGLAQQRWVAINAAIAGEGATPITGVDGRITSHVPFMDDGAGNLIVTYNTGDNIHPNLAGRQLMANKWKEALAVIGLVV